MDQIDQKTKDNIVELGGHEKSFNALYRGLASRFGLSECTMWILFFLRLHEGEEMTQRKLGDLMMFPKQTINSAVRKMAEEGLVELEVIPGTRNRKEIKLTAAGRKLAEKSADKVIEVEERAMRRMSEEKMKKYLQLQGEYLEILKKEFTEEGIIDER